MEEPRELALVTCQRRPVCLARPPDERAHAGEQFVLGEGLDEVVVTADEQPRDAVVRLDALAGNEQHTWPLALGAQLHAHLVTRYAREMDVEHDDVRRLSLRELERLLARRRLVRLVTRAAQDHQHQLAEQRIVVDDEDRSRTSGRRRHSKLSRYSPTPNNKRTQRDVGAPLSDVRCRAREDLATAPESPVGGCGYGICGRASTD